MFRDIQKYLLTLVISHLVLLSHINKADHTLYILIAQSHFGLVLITISVFQRSFSMCIFTFFFFISIQDMCVLVRFAAFQEHSIQKNCSMQHNLLLLTALV